ncbi:FAD:protein FMN transferase [Pseudotabrizicola sediminis]|uniref:FAD:protein FMN transferase n=1 Tax=Pseudotabrizicola sediminis TaxID=2486418 RepID=A0ABY2KH14_9RHOB|nr:FAD:protein FMN transferase [Pseudotabrizicola sediminis]
MPRPFVKRQLAQRVRKTAPVTLDQNGIATGYGVDRLAAVLQMYGIDAALVGIDGEMRSFGVQPDREAWAIAIEAPNTKRRVPLSMLALHDATVATSGDYRRWVNLHGRRLSHTMDPAKGAPLQSSPASVTVVAPTCVEADAWATALMVVGAQVGDDFAQRNGLQALFVLRDETGSLQTHGLGIFFATQPWQ